MSMEKDIQEIKSTLNRLMIAIIGDEVMGHMGLVHRTEMLELELIKQKKQIEILSTKKKWSERKVGLITSATCAIALAICETVRYFLTK